MAQLPSFVDSNFSTHVCRLRKSIYGLKQAPRAWYKALRQFLLDFGFTNSLSDSSLFTYNRNGNHLYFLVYVDEIVLTGSNQALVNSFVTTLNAKFSLKDLGLLNTFLGVEVIHTPSGVLLSQHWHIHDVLEKHKMVGAKGVHTPLNTTEPLLLDDGSAPVDSSLFRMLVGSLQYLQITRPDISFAVNCLSQFMHRPTTKHLQALKRVLRYLKDTIFHGLFLRRQDSMVLSAFADTDWGGCKDSFRCTSGYILYLGSNAISWKSMRQKSVSRSSTEAEYKALASASAELMWNQNLLQELDVTPVGSPTLFSDNMGATYVCASPVFHSRMKHVSLDYHFVREQVQ